MVNPQAISINVKTTPETSSINEINENEPSTEHPSEHHIPCFNDPGPHTLRIRY
jgi:hypothetical protein